VIPPRIKAWSYSRLSNYEKCAFLAKCKYVDKIPEPPAPAMERGKEAHAILEKFMSGYAEDRDNIPGWEHFGPLMVELRALSPLVEQQWGYNDQWQPTDWFGKDTWFRAVLDVAAVYSDNTADVVDFKTGRERDTHADQADLYAVALIMRYPMVKELNVRFWYLDLGTESVFTYTRDQVLPLRQKWEKRALPMLTDTTFAPRPGHHCNWCYASASNGGPCRFG